MPRLLQLNTRSLNTSQHLIKSYAQSKNTQIITLSEIWTPKDLQPLTSSYSSNIRLRNHVTPADTSNDTPAGIHGGVAIFCKHSIKSINTPTLDIKGLEACWTTTYIQGHPTIIGSIYIPPGEINNLDLLDKALGNLEQHENVLITGDLNCRHLLWERWHQHLPDRSSTSWQMGDKLLEMLDRHGYTVLNNGQYTRSTDKHISAPDVTAYKGDKLNYTWQVDHTAHLSSDHHPILVNIGKQ